MAQVGHFWCVRTSLFSYLLLLLVINVIITTIIIITIDILRTRTPLSFCSMETKEIQHKRGSLGGCVSTGELPKPHYNHALLFLLTHIYQIDWVADSTVSVCVCYFYWFIFALPQHPCILLSATLALPTSYILNVIWVSGPRRINYCRRWYSKGPYSRRASRQARG